MNPRSRVTSSTPRMTNTLFVRVSHKLLEVDPKYYGVLFLFNIHYQKPHLGPTSIIALLWVPTPQVRAFGSGALMWVPS